MLWFLFGGMILCVVLLPVFLAERWCRRHRQKKGFPVPKGMGWLQHTAVWLLYHLPESVRESAWLKGCAEVAAGKLHPGMKKEAFCRQHQVMKLMLIYGGGILIVIILMGCWLFGQPQKVDNYHIQREDAKGSSRTVMVDAQIEGQDTVQEFVLHIHPRLYAAEEQAQLMAQVKSYIDQMLPAENTDLWQVQSDLYFPDSFPGENVSIEWHPEDYNLLHQDGSLGDFAMDMLPVETRVTAVIHYGNETIDYEKVIRIIGKKQSEGEELREGLQAAIEKADENSAGKLQMPLPKQINGYQVSWQYHQDYQGPVLAVLAICFVVCLIVNQEVKLKRQMERRMEQLVYDYPGFVHKMILLLGAGMTVRKSWNQVVSDYERDVGSKQCENWLYQEMRYTRIQMQSGVPEIEAYLDFGRRTELPQYMKFTQLLFQYIRRGSQGMQEMMMQEAYEAEKQRRDLARRLGETAGTKLLFPMMLLLLIVLAVVMAPAFLTTLV